MSCHSEPCLIKLGEEGRLADRFQLSSSLCLASRCKYTGESLLSMLPLKFNELAIHFEIPAARHPVVLLPRAIN